MHNNTLYYALLLVCLSFGSLFAEPVQYEDQVVEKIDVEVVHAGEGEKVEASSVLARMKTRQGAHFSQTDFDNDLKTLVQEFDRVDPVLNSVEGKLYITLKVWPKPTIRTISWQGNSKLDTKCLQSELDISTCTVFDRQSFNKAFHKLKAYYVKNGFFEASLDYTTVLDPATNTVDIEIQVNEGRAGRIKRIRFVNFTSDEQDAICEEMVTKRYILLTSWYTGEGTYNEDAMQQDRHAILNFLQNEGYADAAVEIDICEAEQNNRIIITITAEKGEVYYFGPVTFEGNTLYCNEEVEEHLLIAEGDAYSPEAIRDTEKRLTDLYGRRGYIDAIVTHEMRLDCANRLYTVHFTIEEGDQYRVGLIKVYGNCSTQTNVILHEIFFVPGEIFNTIKLQVTEERLRNIGYFKHVNVYAVKSDGPEGLGACYRDVHIEVEETVTGNFGAGFGVSSVESVFGEFRISEKNFNYKGLGSFWRDGLGVLRGGGEYVHLNAMIGSKSRKYSLSWTKPYFNDTKWIVGFELETSTNRYISDDYNINSTGITLNGLYPFNSFLKVGTHYRLRNGYITLNRGRIRHTEKKLEREAEGAREEGNEHKAKKKFHEIEGLSCKLREESKNLGLISAIGLSLVYDSTNNPVFPTRGFKSRLEQEVAGFGGDHAFMGLAYLNSYYIPVGERGVVRFRGDMRFIVPLFDTNRFHIPIDERLFLGGENTIRGFRVYKLGPQYNPGDPRGGMSLQLLSVEYTRVLNKKMSAFLFCDSGHLSFDVWGFGKMWTSVGFGITLQAFESAPPVVLGMGFPINPDKRSDVKRFFFTLGGQF